MPDVEFGQVIRGLPVEDINQSEVNAPAVRLEIDDKSKKDIEKIEANSRVAVQIRMRK